MKDKIKDIFEVPDEVNQFMDKMISENEMKLIYIMGIELYTAQELAKLINSNFETDVQRFIENSYKRSILDKLKKDETIFFKTSSIYSRISIFAQFENDTWQSIDINIRQAVDKWYVSEYAKRSKLKVERFNKGEVGVIENAYFFTLEEALKLIEDTERDLYLLPCNCKSVAMSCSKPVDVCIQFDEDINTMVDRGWGKNITKSEAKEIIKYANKLGLMHTSETDSAICNCDGCCCYPIRASKLLGTKKEWPKATNEIKWDKEKCINCGKCTEICNFKAFHKKFASLMSPTTPSVAQKDNVVEFDESKCWGCTICKDNCPIGAISLIN